MVHTDMWRLGALEGRLHAQWYPRGRLSGVACDLLLSSLIRLHCLPHLVVAGQSRRDIGKCPICVEKAAERHKVSPACSQRALISGDGLAQDRGTYPPP